MIQDLAKKHAQKLRFGIVGAANTVLDFGILFLLVHLGLDKIVANYISTSIAFCSSFYFNRKFTFKAKGGNLKKEIALFLVVTMIGLWVIQPLVIAGVAALITPLHLQSSLALLSEKLVATVASLIWNYIMYAKFVFPAPKQDQESKEA
jgi:putative flippase GtrA